MILYHFRKPAANQSSFVSIFRAANSLGLFPVSGMSGTHAGDVEFRPLSIRVVATGLFFLAVLVLEGLGLVHMLVIGRPTHSETTGKHGFSRFNAVLNRSLHNIKKGISFR